MQVRVKVPQKFKIDTFGTGHLVNGLAYNGQLKQEGLSEKYVELFQVRHMALAKKKRIPMKDLVVAKDDNACFQCGHPHGIRP